MKIYLMVDNTTKVIKGYSFNYLVGTIGYEVEKPEEIQLNLDTFENGKVIHQELPEDYRIRARITELKKQLADTDYMSIKCSDGEITKEEYAPTRALRHAWRREIRELEEKLK